MRQFRTQAVLATLLLTTLLVGCNKQKLIPNTKVSDTKFNREILKVVEDYRKAMAQMDAVKVLTMVHPTYQDHAGTPEGSDDIDYEGLKTILTSQLKKTSKVRFNIEYQDVSTKGREARVDTYIDATFVYTTQDANPRWRRLTDFNRFRLLQDKNKRWRFISGL